MTRLTAGVAAGALAIGILVGAAGTVVVGNVTDDGQSRGFDQMGSMMNMMSGSGMDSMGEMDGAEMDSMMNMMSGSGSMGPGGSQHEAHHPEGDQ